MNAPRRGPGGYDGGQAIEAVGTGRVDAVALRSDALGRIDSWEPRLGAVTAILQRRPASTGSLAGLVVGVKDQVDMEGHPHPIAGHGGAVPVAAARDAPVVTRLEAAGATIVARTASPPPGSPGGVTPQTANPRQPDRISGGSSGGSAAAVAAGLVHAAIGTDSGGSIRIPAACCGVVGLNPTRGLVPLDRTGGLTYSIGSVGPLASTVADVRRVLAAIADPRPGDDQRDDQIGRSAGHLRIGVPGSVLGAKLDSDVRQGLEVVLSLLRDAGHEVDRVQVPMVDESMELGPRTVGVAEYAACLADEFPSALGTPEHRALRQAAASITSTRLARAYHRIGLLRAAVLRVLEDVDFLLTPTLPCQVPAGSEAHREAEVDVGGGVETRTSALTRLVNPWNLAGVPASSQPVARDSDGAPISVQLIGPPFSEGRLLDLMELVERLTGGSWDTVAPPSVTPRR